MAERAYESTEAWGTALRLAAAVGRLRIASNLRAVTEAQDRAFAEAGRACALLAEGSTHEGGAQLAAYRDARGALAQCEAWLQIVAELTNEPAAVFASEMELADLAARQIGASIRAAEMRRDTGRPGGPMGGPPRQGAGGRPNAGGIIPGPGTRGGGPRPPRGGDR
jgi:hypothetical protein